MSNVNENDVVILNLDRPRELRFGYKAIKRVLSSSGMSMDDLSEGKFDLDQVEKFIFFGLQKDANENGETLTLEQIEDLLDYAPFNEILDAFQRAISYAFGNHVEGNEQAEK